MESCWCLVAYDSSKIDSHVLRALDSMSHSNIDLYELNQHEDMDSQGLVASASGGTDALCKICSHCIVDCGTEASRRLGNLDLTSQT
jgi:hypothetical protein